MKQPSAMELASAPRLPTMGSVDTATLELLAAWKSEDTTTDPEKLREADGEIAEFKKSDECKPRSDRRQIAFSVSRFLVLDSAHSDD